MSEENNRTKEYLRQHELSVLKIRTLEKEIAELTEGLYRSPVSDGMPHSSGKSDPTGTFGAKLADMRKEAEYLWEEQQKIRKSIERTLYRLKNAEQFAVLWAKYIELKDWPEIADEQDRTVRTVQRIHGQGLKEVSEIIRETDNKLP